MIATAGRLTCLWAIAVASKYLSSSLYCLRQGNGTHRRLREAFTRTVIPCLFFVAMPKNSSAAFPQGQRPGDALKQLTLEQLANTEVITVSKEPAALQRTPAAIYILTQEDIRRSGATSLPSLVSMAASQPNPNHWPPRERIYSEGWP